MASNFVAFFSRDKVLAIQITYTVYRYTDDCTLANFEFLRVKVDICVQKNESQLENVGGGYYRSL